MGLFPAKLFQQWNGCCQNGGLAKPQTNIQLNKALTFTQFFYKFENVWNLKATAAAESVIYENFEVGNT